MKILMNGRVYQSDDKAFISNLLRETKKIFIDRNQSAIYALEKKEYIEFTKTMFATKRELMQAVTALTRAGFKVHYYLKEKV